MVRESSEEICFLKGSNGIISIDQLGGLNRENQEFLSKNAAEHKKTQTGNVTRNVPMKGVKMVGYDRPCQL